MAVAEPKVEPIEEALVLVSRGKPLSREQAAAVMERIMEGDVTGAQFGALAMGLSLRGETVDEIAGFASVMRERAIRVHVGQGGTGDQGGHGDPPLLDTCGTGGDRAGTFNISTTAAFVAAAAGARVAKHGNRAASSHAGSADVLEALGADIMMDAAGVERTIRETGMGFMFAPAFHPAMKHAAGPRRELRVRTIFNILGPLTNPAFARHQVLGVADGSVAARMVEVLRELGSRHALVVHGEDGLDELTLSGPSQVYELVDGEIRRYEVTPGQFGLPHAPLDAIRGGDRETNAAITRAVLGGEQGPRRDVVLLNAAAALVAADLATDIPEGIEVAARAIDGGAAQAKMEAFVRSTREANGSP